MTRGYFTKFDGFYYTAMCTADRARKMDMTRASIIQRERSGRLFFEGWSERLEELKIIVRFEYQYQKFLWLVDSEAAAYVLDCRPCTVLKYLEVMRHIRFIPQALGDLPGVYGYERCATREPVSPSQIFDSTPKDSDSDTEEEEEEESTDSDMEDYDPYAYIIAQSVDDSHFELPPVCEAELFQYL